MNKAIWTAIIVAYILFGLAWADKVFSQDVKYCRYGDGSLVAVEANMPCPYGSIEI